MITKILSKISGKQYEYKFDFLGLANSIKAQASPMSCDTKVEDIDNILAPLLVEENENTEIDISDV